MSIFHNDFLSCFFSHIIKCLQHFFGSFKIQFSIKKLVSSHTFWSFSFPHRSTSQKKDIPVNRFTLFKIMCIPCGNYNFILTFSKFVKILVHFLYYIVTFNFLARSFHHVSIICVWLNFDIIIKSRFFLNVVFFCPT